MACKVTVNIGPAKGTVPSFSQTNVDYDLSKRGFSEEILNNYNAFLKLFKSTESADEVEISVNGDNIEVVCRSNSTNIVYSDESRQYSSEANDSINVSFHNQTGWSVGLEKPSFYEMWEISPSTSRIVLETLLVLLKEVRLQDSSIEIHFYLKEGAVYFNLNITKAFA
jgi:hypothetical protein